MSRRRSEALGLFRRPARHSHLQPRNQDTVSEITELDSKHWLDTFDTNIHSFFYLTKAAIPHLQKSPTKQPTIVFNDSINAFKGHPDLVDYTATKGAILGFARSLNAQLTGKTGIRVNCTSEANSPPSRMYECDLMESRFRCCSRSNLDSVDVCFILPLERFWRLYSFPHHLQPAVHDEREEREVWVKHHGRTRWAAGRGCYVFRVPRQRRFKLY